MVRSVEHPVMTDGHCQACVRVCPANGSTGAGMAQSVGIAADARRRGRLFTAQPEPCGPDTNRPAEDEVGLIAIWTKNAEGTNALL